MFDCSNLCRLCTLSENLKFSLESTDINNITVEDKLKWLEPNILQDDNLPVFICEICHEKLNQAFAFKEQCLYSLKKLQNYMIHSLDAPKNDQQVGEIKEELDISEDSFSDAKSETNFDIKDEEVLDISDDSKSETNFDIKNDETSQFNFCETEIVEDEYVLSESLLTTKVNQTLEKKSRILRKVNEFGAIRSANNRFEYTIQKDSEKIVYINNFREKIFSCNNCQKHFSGFTALKRHILVHLKYRAYKCDICGVETYTNAALKSHKVMHQEDKGSIICDICGKTFKSKGRLQSHSYCHSKNYVCDLCGKKFSSMSLLKKHQICKHGNKRDFVCTICGFAAKTPAYLKRHMTRHDPEKKFKCSLCQQLLKSSRSLKIHIRRHEQDTKFTCHVCNKRFVLKSHYDIHFRIHSNEKPYLCTYCEKRFRRQDHLKNHVRIHTKEKPFACDMCDKAFAQKISLVVHQRTHKNIKKIINCEHCDESFCQLSRYKNHLTICKSK